MKALMIVDLQNDFCPGGALPAPEGDKVVPVINKLMKTFDHIIASKDWHPEDSVHFTRWPKHCIKNTKGAEFHPDLNTENIDFVFLKGTEGEDDGYSAFDATNENFIEYLKRNHITDLYVTGLTTEFCVKETALDAARHDFNTFVVRDAVEGVKAKKGDEQEALAEMEAEGVKLINASLLLNE